MKQDKLARLKELQERAKLGGGLERIEAQHSKGKLTARERIKLLLDEGSFEEIDSLVTHRATDFGLERYLGDSVVVGHGKIDGRKVFVFAQDFTVFGGSISEMSAQKICKVMDLAMKVGAPIIGINDSGGARIQEGVSSLKGYGEIFLRNTLASGLIPQISLVLGPCAGGASYSPAITDFVFMVKGISFMYITGPDVVREAIGEEISHEELGGAMVHASKSGVAHFIADSEEECFKMVRRLLSYLPSNNREKPPRIQPKSQIDIDEEILKLIPDDPLQPYDMKKVILRLVDDGDFMEVQEHFAPNIIIGFGRIGGYSVGIVAQQPLHAAGSLDINASTKAARFIRFCDCFNIPIISLVDIPGYLPGVDQEHGGIIRHGAKLLFAYAEATVPKITVILRKAYGGGYVVMGSKHLRGDINFAWPTAEIAVTGAEGAVSIIYRREIASSPNPEETRRKLIEEYREKFSNPYIAASYGYIDEVIDPRLTRIKLVNALEMLKEKEDFIPPKKHGNIPL